MKRKLHNLQLAILRAALASPIGVSLSDRSTAKALIARGYAERWDVPTSRGWRNAIRITESGRDRARKAADYHVARDGHADDPSLMEDLP